MTTRFGPRSEPPLIGTSFGARRVERSTLTSFERGPEATRSRMQSRAQKVNAGAELSLPRRPDTALMRYAECRSLP